MAGTKSFDVGGVTESRKKGERWEKTHIPQDMGLQPTPQKKRCLVLTAGKGRVKRKRTETGRGKRYFWKKTNVIMNEKASGRQGHHRGPSDRALQGAIHT